MLLTGPSVPSVDNIDEREVPDVHEPADESGAAARSGGGGGGWGRPSPASDGATRQPSLAAPPTSRPPTRGGHGGSGGGATGPAAAPLLALLLGVHAPNVPPPRLSVDGGGPKLPASPRPLTPSGPELAK